jgi:hypothetical protein
MIPRPSDLRKKEQPTIKVVESENDFPIAKVTHITVGSAHAVARDSRVAATLLQITQKLVERWHGAGPIPAIEVLNESTEQQTSVQ